MIEAEDGLTALKLLQEPLAPQIAILDWMMPGMHGPEVVQKLRQSKPSSYTYILLYTAKSDKADVLTGLNSGADDYLTKPCDARELRARLRVGERIIELQSSLQNALSASEFRATHDALTGLYNRGAIIGLLQREVTRCLREGSSVGVMLGDIDHFKSVNDTYGHAAGDQVLLETAGRMHSALRSYDFLGRYGGEEFLVVAPGCGPADIEGLAERLRLALARTPVRLGEKSLNVTISIGASIAGGSADIEALLSRVDAALYTAKRDGRDRVRFAPVPQEEQVALVPRIPELADNLALF